MHKHLEGGRTQCGGCDASICPECGYNGPNGKMVCETCNKKMRGLANDMALGDLALKNLSTQRERMDKGIAMANQRYGSDMMKNQSAEYPEPGDKMDRGLKPVQNQYMSKEQGKSCY